MRSLAWLCIASRDTFERLSRLLRLASFRTFKLDLDMMITHQLGCDFVILHVNTRNRKEKRGFRILHVGSHHIWNL